MALHTTCGLISGAASTVFKTSKLIISSPCHEDIWGGAELWLHIFLTLALDGDEWSTLHSVRFNFITH